MRFAKVAGTNVRFSIWLARVSDFAAFTAETGYDATKDVYSFSPKGWVQKGDTWMSPGFAQKDNSPVCAMSWFDAKAFCEWLTKKERLAGQIGAHQVYRLPTEAEWKIAVGLIDGVSGTANKDAKTYPWGDKWPPPPGAGNYCGTETRDDSWPTTWPVFEDYTDGFARTSPVGTYPPNRFGLYDMSGNLWEWCEDLFTPDGETRVVRGGAFRANNRDALKLAYRGDGPPKTRYIPRGFRCVLTTPIPGDGK